MRAATILDTIGNTPIVDVSELSPNPRVRILAKLEGQNPGGSVKDRIALAIIEGAEQRGDLKPGGTIVEGTSGNTGVGLLMIDQELSGGSVPGMPASPTDAAQE